MRKVLAFVVASGLAAFVTMSLSAADATIKGVVTDAAGKPVRGATVTATSGIKNISRFTQADGRYQISVAPGNYDVSVQAYGFGVKATPVDAAKGQDTNFSLSPAPLPLQLTRLTGAELEGVIPDSPEKRLLIARCVECHSFPTVLHRRGHTAAQWKEFLPDMVKGATDEPFEHSSATTLNVISAALEKYFGPNSPQFGLEAKDWATKVQHVELADDALGATIVEYTISNVTSRPHSITVDAKANRAWFAMQSFFANKAASFDIATETLHEYPLLTPKARPHTGAVAKDGTFYVALAHGNDPAKLAWVDPRTGAVKQYNWPEKTKTPAHTLTLDQKGNVWFSGSPSGEIWMFDTTTKEFKTYKNPPPPAVPEGTWQDWVQKGGEPAEPPRATTYDTAVDNEGIIWFSEVSLGTLVRLDPATGQTMNFRPEGVVSIRGITVDPVDNLWFGDFHGHRLGKMNVKTKTVTMYKPPTPNATAYGITYNPVDGNIWYADMNGNNITRFNPKTEKFTEFRIPNRSDSTYSRFIGSDAKGRVWFTEYFGNRIGYVDPTGGEENRVSSAR